MSRVWGVVLALMIGYFVLSIITSTARSYFLQQDEAKLKELQQQKQLKQRSQSQPSH